MLTRVSGRFAMSDAPPTSPCVWGHRKNRGSLGPASCGADCPGCCDTAAIAAAVMGKNAELVVAAQRESEARRRAMDRDDQVVLLQRRTRAMESRKDKFLDSTVSGQWRGLTWSQQRALLKDIEAREEDERKASAETAEESEAKVSAGGARTCMAVVLLYGGNGVRIRTTTTLAQLQPALIRIRTLTATCSHTTHAPHPPHPTHLHVPSTVAPPGVDDKQPAGPRHSGWGSGQHAHQDQDISAVRSDDNDQNR